MKRNLTERKEKKLMIRHGKKNNTIKQWSQQRKKISLEKKQFRNMKNKQEITVPKIQNSGYWVISIFRMH